MRPVTRDEQPCVPFNIGEWDEGVGQAGRRGEGQELSVDFAEADGEGSAGLERGVDSEAGLGFVDTEFARVVEDLG